MSQAKIMGTIPARIRPTTMGRQNWTTPPSKYWYTEAREATGMVRMA